MADAPTTRWSPDPQGELVEGPGPGAPAEGRPGPEPRTWATASGPAAGAALVTPPSSWSAPWSSDWRTEWAPPAAPAAPARAGGRRRGFWGSLLAGLVAVLKYGGLLLKLGAFKGTLITMAISVFFYSLFFGPVFAVAFVALILVHEMGHFVVARRMGEDVSAPMFIPFLGALINMRRPPRTVAREATVAMAGPLVGTLVSLAILALAVGLHSEFLAALAYIGCLLNLFNLIPASPLDGGRVTAAVSKWANLVGLVILIGYAAWAFTIAHAASPILLIIVVVAGYSTWGRFRQARRQPEYLTVPMRTRFVVGGAYLALVLAAALGLAASHPYLVHLATQVG